MKTFTYFIFVIILVFTGISCSDKNIMLYHPIEEVPEPEPEKKWLLKHIDYPEARTELINRNDVTLSYNSDLKIETIDNLNSDYIMINYSPDSITYAKEYKSGNYMMYDSLLVRINRNECVTSVLHTTHREKDGEKSQIQNDSTFFGYNAENHLIRMERYNRSGDEKPTYWEDYTFTNGNLTEVISSAGYRHTYTYNDKDYSLTSSYCYEVPFNTISISNWGGCWLLTNCRFLSDYLGKKSLKNISHVAIYKNGKEEQTPELYVDIDYDYTYDENDLVVKVKLTGSANGTDIPEDYTTIFSYIEEGSEESESTPKTTGGSTLN